MKTLDLNTNTQSKRNRRRLLVLLVLLVLSSIGVFGQNNNINSVEINVDFKVENSTNESKTNIVSVESQIDFVGWFMCTKYNQNNATFDVEKGRAKTSTKKQMLSSGIEPNRVLYRTFVKKVMNKDSAIA